MHRTLTLLEKLIHTKADTHLGGEAGWWGRAQALDRGHPGPGPGPTPTVPNSTATGMK